MRYGAEITEWDKFLSLGLQADLLPVVSNPKAEISPNSFMKSLGKTPSIYNKDKKVIGLVEWTQKQSTKEQIEVCRKNPDYGICIQTRKVRALDIDIENKELALKVQNFIEDWILIEFPKRFRGNSAKFLFAFVVNGAEYTKRILKVEGGIIEFLATGQQFVAAGQHSSGSRYVWDWRGHSDFPVIEAAEFEKLWLALVEEFGIAASSTMGARRARGANADIPDPILDRLEVLDWGNEGQAFITCPWKAEHSMDSGISETAYFPRGSRGYEQGHFKCLHAHCAARTDSDFTRALGLDNTDFQVLDVKKEPPRPRFIINKEGDKLAIAHNTDTALSRADYSGITIGQDKFRDEIMLSADEGKNWRSIKDTDHFEIRLMLERKGFKPIPMELIRNTVSAVAERNQFDSAVIWLNSLAWDGVSRIDGFLNSYFGAADNEYSKAVGRYMWTALAGRILAPGCQVDMVPVLQGDEGIQKSSAVAALVPDPDFFAEMSFDDKEDDIARKMRGKLVLEIAELRGLSTRDHEHILAFVTRRSEKWTPKYKEYQTTLARRCVFFGTTNDDAFLPKDGRRWLPFNVTMADAKGIARDRLQLWAEAREMFKAHGVLYQAVEEQGKEARASFIQTDVWETDIHQWLYEEDIAGTSRSDSEYILLRDILVNCLGIDSRNIKKSDEMRAAKILRSAGYTKKQTRRGKSVFKAWFKV